MSKVNFIHKRWVRDGVTLNFGGTTIAFREVEGGVEYAVAHCSPHDNFNKAMGRVKSAGRLESRSYRMFKAVDFKEFIKTYASDILV